MTKPKITEKMLEKVVLQFPDCLKISLNQYYAGLHWTKRKKLKDNYAKWFLQYKNQFKKIDEGIEMQFDFHFNKRPLDCDNCVVMAKMIVDCMIKSEIIKDDTYKHIMKVSYTSKKTKDDNYVVITIIN